jgi:hypothetical protein
MHGIDDELQKAGRAFLLRLVAECSIAEFRSRSY